MNDVDVVTVLPAEFVEDVHSTAIRELTEAAESGERNEWVTIAEAAKRLAVSPDRVRRRLKAGEFEARQVATRYGPTWEIHLGDPVRHDSPPPRVSPSVTEAPRVVPTLTNAAAVEDDGVATLELVRLVRYQQDQLTQLAGQVGFLQAQLQQAHEAIKLLQAPVLETVDEAATAGTETPDQAVVMAEEVGRLKAELEQAQRRVAEVEATTEEPEREGEAAEKRRPWWKFW